MKKIVLTVCFSLLFSGSLYAREPLAVKVDVLEKTGVSWNDTALPDYAKGSPEVTILRISIPPGVRLPLHTHPYINAGVLLHGKLSVVTQEGAVLHMEAGDPIVEVVNQWHYGKNEGSEPAELIMFYAGIKGEPITVKAEGAE
ncbi:MAG: cupin domain-containing protein [Chlorobium phaeobacteroides]|uniref:Cupin 2 conserved barrel domain protein n=1 Tax=Chlorobium phaeobacteroides (strain BS1) TaxID=331678 RepID=B3EPE1_CHLPB|nr:cupin domain-containing protein [Chlorobium phaeobacteroides]